jgi:hypothetical protein
VETRVRASAAFAELEASIKTSREGATAKAPDAAAAKVENK